MHVDKHGSMNRRDHLKLIGAAGMAAAGLPALGQTSNWPDKPVRWVVPFAPGGTSSIVARSIGAELTKQLGVPFVIDNKGGGGGVPAMQEALRAPADGYTIVMSHIGLMAVNPLIYPDSGYDVNKDFTSVTLLSRVPSLFVIHKDVPAKDFKSFVAYVKSKPGQLNYASAGNASAGHLAVEALKVATGMFITHIPYRGAGPALQDLIVGNVDMMFDGLGSSAAHIKGGRIKALMVSGTKRNPAFPDVPCSTELGLPDYTVSTWYGVWAPKGTSPDAQAKAIEEFRRACQTDEAKAVWANQGAEFPNLTGAQFEAFIKKELAKWSQVVKASGAKLD